MKLLLRSLCVSIAYYVSAIVFSGCCNCPPGAIINYRWSGMSVGAGAYVIDSTHVRITEDSTTDFAGKNLVLNAKLDYELLASRTERSAELISSAYACKCIEETYNLSHKASGIKVVTLKAFNSSHPAQSDVSEYFGTPYYSGTGTFQEFFPISYLVQPTSDDHYRLQNMYRLYLTTRPDAGTQQQFRVLLTLDDSTTFTATSPVLQF